MNDRDHITPIGRLLYKLGLQPMPCYAAVLVNCWLSLMPWYGIRRAEGMRWDWEWGAGATAAACWPGGLVRRGGMGHGCTGCGSCDSSGPWQRVDWCSGGAKHSTSGSNYCFSNTVTHQTRQLYTRPTRPVISLMACLITPMPGCLLDIYVTVAHVLPARWRWGTFTRYRSRSAPPSD